MKVQKLKTGGIMGINKKYPVIDVSKLPIDIQNKLNQLIDDADFFNYISQSDVVGNDMLYDTLIINTKDRDHSVTIVSWPENNQNISLEKLFRYVDSIYRRTDNQRLILVKTSKP